MQTLTVEYSVFGSLDGTTPSPPVDTGPGTTVPDPDQIFRVEVADLGLLDPDLLFPSLGSYGPRAVAFIFIDGTTGTSSPGAAVDLVSVIDEDDVRVQRNVLSFPGELVRYSAPGVFVPQGSALRLQGLTAGAQPIRIRVTLLVPESIEDFVQIVEAESGGGAAAAATPFGLRIVGLNVLQPVGSVNLGVPLFAEPLPTEGDFGVPLSDWLEIVNDDELGTSFRILEPGVYGAEAVMTVTNATAAVAVSLDASGFVLTAGAAAATMNVPTILVNNFFVDPAGRQMPVTTNPFFVTQSMIDSGLGVVRPLVHAGATGVFAGQFAFFLHRSALLGAA